VEDDWEPIELQSNMFEMECRRDPDSGRLFLNLTGPNGLALGQAVFLDRLLTVIADNSTMPPAGRSAQKHSK
jgi:hypothetical protein